MRILATALLLAGCATAPVAGLAPDRFIVRDGPSTMPLALPDSPPAFVPTSGISAPARGVAGGGLSKVCTPEPNGIGADCRAL